ncbi:hypothetical protein IQ07DRAFT_505682 [Pyrenochaeta sp. DS3sAY3a]|nr:hypothetical protein IQ07DRAFT_505682 [Pyrenochaeta sp. DS3sAY3a]
MPSPITFTIFTRSPPHALRAISLATLPLSFLLLLIHGILSGHVNPAIGILPLFFSAAYSALLLANEKKCGCMASGLTGTPVHLAVDLALGAGSFVCLILAWISLGESGFIHAYFVAKQIKDHLNPGMKYPMSCPQCQNVVFSFGPLSSVPVSLGGYKFAPGWKQEYTPLLDEENQGEGVGNERGENADEVAGPA